MLGLKYGTVRLVEHDNGWSDAFLRERAVLVQALDGVGCAIEHIGSTAVSGLPAKPILDIAMGFPDSADPKECFRRLEMCGYEYRGDAGGDGGHVFVRAQGDFRTHHVHGVLLGGVQWRAYLALRDLLRVDENARSLYSRSKRELAQQFSHDRKSYLKGKDEIVTRLLARHSCGPTPV